VYSQIDGESETSRNSLEAALALWRYADATAGWLFGTPFNHAEADRIYDTLRRRPGGMTRTEINSEVFSNHANADRLREGLAILE
jgi:hypothetical protein